MKPAMSPKSNPPKNISWASKPGKFYVSILGPSAVGKTSISAQAANGTFSTIYSPTIEKTHDIVIERGGERYIIDVMDTMGNDEVSLK